jgi:hypothetical protein
VNPRCCHRSDHPRPRYRRCCRGAPCSEWARPWQEHRHQLMATLVLDEHLPNLNHRIGRSHLVIHRPHFGRPLDPRPANPKLRPTNRRRRRRSRHRHPSYRLPLADRPKEVPSILMHHPANPLAIRRRKRPLGHPEIRLELHRPAIHLEILPGILLANRSKCWGCRSPRHSDRAWTASRACWKTRTDRHRSARASKAWTASKASWWTALTRHHHRLKHRRESWTDCRLMDCSTHLRDCWIRRKDCSTRLKGYWNRQRDCWIHPTGCSIHRKSWEANWRACWRTTAADRRSLP